MRARTVLFAVATMLGAPLGSASAGDNLLPRCETFRLDGEASSIGLTLFVGGSQSTLHGRLVLGFGDPPDASIAPAVRVSIGESDLVATNWSPALPTIDDPAFFRMTPADEAGGTWNPQTGEISFSFDLLAAGAQLPVPMPVEVEGTLVDGRLRVEGDNGNVADGMVRVEIDARAIDCRRETYFSTEVGFTTAGDAGSVSDGDLLGRRECVAARNADLTSRLGFQPVVPDLGLDAATLVAGGPTFFSTEDPLFSETLGPIGHGDLLSAEGLIVRTNAELLDPFWPIPGEGDRGLDAVHAGFVLTALFNGGIFFSTEEDFWSEQNKQMIGHGDLLYEGGSVFRSNQDLLREFEPVDPETGEPIERDLGLDAVYIFSIPEIWFSVEEPFTSRTLGYIDDGAILSERGVVVAQNLDLLFGDCQPLEDLANFGLDALDFDGCFGCHVGCPEDLNGDGRVGPTDLGIVLAAWGSPCPLAAPICRPDLDGDGNVDSTDVGILIAAWGPCD